VDVPPVLNFAPFDNSADALTRSAERYQTALQKAWPAGISAATLADLNQKLKESERRLTTPEGLLRRPWYRHMIYAPGVYSGYGVKTLPGIREAIEERFWAEADSEIVRVANVLNGVSALIDSAAAELENAGH
jgi:N-acetylated-alpha-linked acidic dipeptidase